MKNFKLLKIIITVLLVILIIITITVFQIYLQDKKSPIEIDESDKYYPSARDAGQWDDPNFRKIKVEILSEEERAEANFSSRLVDPADIQVLSRDENGEITSYRKVYKPTDIIDSLYDPTGEKTAGMTIE